MRRVPVGLAWLNDHRAVEYRPVEGWTSGVPGLVIVPGGSTLDRWQLIHQASGLLIRGGFPSRREAAEMAERLRPVTDWTLPAAELARVEGFAERKAEALEDRPTAVSVHGWVG
jgi:hypothetical protein